MIALTERSVEANAIASAIERAGGRLMMLFVVPLAGGGRELNALVSDGDSVARLRAPLHGEAYPAITPQYRRRTGSSARSTTCPGSHLRATPVSSRSFGTDPTRVRSSSPSRRTCASSIGARSGSPVRACS